MCEGVVLTCDLLYFWRRRGVGGCFNLAAVFLPVTVRLTKLDDEMSVAQTSNLPVRS